MRDLLEYCEANTEGNEALENEFNIHFSSLIIYYTTLLHLMGCEVTSVYNDEIPGKMGYSQQIIDDLLQRDFREAFLMQEKEINVSNIQNIEGFSQSFVIGKLFFTVVAETQYIVYSLGRFIIMEEMKSKKRKFIQNRDFITAFIVKDKLCLTGVYGGFLILWDIQFLQIKLQILLPEQSLNISSVGFSSKYLFATDCSQPNNLSFCYDIRTGKLKCYAKVPTLQPILRSVTFGQNTYIIACADGIWFIEIVKNPEELIITRGLFGGFPKTSIICIEQAQKYIIGGGVDGYIYAWNTSTIKCSKALKVHDGEITAIAVKNNHIILACMNGKVKVYTFKITKKEKKENEIRLEEQQEKRQAEENEILTFILVDTFDKQGSIFTIAISQKDHYLYYCQTRQGLLFQKRLPNHSITNKTSKAILNQDIQRFNGKSKIFLFKNIMYTLYLSNNIHKIVNNSIVLQQERAAKLKDLIDNQHFTYLVNSNQIAILTKSNKIVISQTFSKIGALANSNQSDLGQNSTQLIQLNNEKIVCINFIYAQPRSLLIVTTNETIFIFERQAKLLYQQIIMRKYQKDIPSPLRVGSINLVFQQKSLKWGKEEQVLNNSREQELKKLEVLHGGPVQRQNSWGQLRMSVGKGVLIFYK